MPELKEFPYFEVEFDKNGKSAKAAQVKALTNFLAEGNTTDLFVISHGWNNDMDEARRLYTSIFECVRAVLNSKDGKSLSKRKFAIMAVLWPSHKFAEKELIPSGAAGLESPFTNDFLKQELDEMKAVFNTKKGRATLDKAKLLIPKLEDSKKARTEFADLLRSLLPKQASPDVDAAGDFSKLPGDELLQRLSKPVPVTLSKPKTGGGAARLRGGAAGVGDFFSGIKSSAAHMLNLITYYQMKERSGIVGSTGVNDILRSIRAQNGKVKLHLVGHSFGGRLVVSAVAGNDDHPPVRVDSLTLLQAAFSHYGFSKKYDGSNDGFFRKVISDKLVSGPTLISCTDNDKAVGLAYPLASLLAGQVAAGLGDKDNKYGGIGRNGAQKTPEASVGTLLKVGGSYDFKAGKLYNLNSDAIITGHSDLEHNEVAYALLTAVATT
jgi:hypothetical protein